MLGLRLKKEDLVFKDVEVVNGFIKVLFDADDLMDSFVIVLVSLYQTQPLIIAIVLNVI